MISGSRNPVLDGCGLLTRNSVLASWPLAIILPTASVGAFLSFLPSRATPAAQKGANSGSSGQAKTGNWLICSRCLRHLSISPPSIDLFTCPPPLSGRQGQSGNPPHHRSEQPPHQMTLCQKQPIVPGVHHQPATRLHQPLLQAGQRYLLDLHRQMLQSVSQDELHITDGRSERREPVKYTLANGLPSIWRRQRPFGVGLAFRIQPWNPHH